VGERIHLAQVADVGRFLERVLANGADVDVFHRGVGQLLGVVERGQPVEAVVGNLGDADVRLARIGMGLGRKMRLGQDAEQRCLAYLGQANNAGFHKKLLAVSFWLLAGSLLNYKDRVDGALGARQTTFQDKR
jgi:hypothetical protein